MPGARSSSWSSHLPTSPAADQARFPLPRVYGIQHHLQAHFAVAVLCLLPLALAAFVAATRITDYKHAPADVNAGAALGLLCGTFGYLLNFSRWVRGVQGVRRTNRAGAGGINWSQQYMSCQFKVYLNGLSLACDWL